MRNWLWVIGILGCGDAELAALGLDVIESDGENAPETSDVDSPDPADRAEVSEAPDGSVAEKDAAGESPDSQAPEEVADEVDAAGENDAVEEADVGPAVDSSEAGPDVGPETPETVTPSPTDPGAVGSFTSSKSDSELVIEPGLFGTKVGLVIYTPKGTTNRPVVVFTHGFQLSPADYADTAEHLASWGYVVVLPNLGQSFTTTHVQQKDKLLEVLDWIGQQAGAASGPLAGVADPSRIVMAGHSMGGKLSFFVAAEDTRPVAVFGVDPVDASGGLVPLSPADYPSIAPERMGDISIPFIVVGETTNSAGGLLGTPCAPAADNFHQYFAGATGPAAELEFVGAWHMSWLDEVGFSCLACLACDKGSADDAVVRTVTRRVLVAFLKVFVEGDQSFRTWLDGPAAEPDVTSGLVKRATKNAF